MVRVNIDALLGASLLTIKSLQHCVSSLAVLFAYRIFFSKNKNEKKQKNMSNSPKIKSGVLRTIRRGKSFSWVKKNLLCTVVMYLQSMLQKHEKIALYYVNIIQ